MGNDNNNKKDKIIRFENFFTNNNPSRIDKIEELLESFDLSFIIGKIISNIPEEEFNKLHESFLEMKPYMDIDKINEEKGRLKRLVG